MGRALVALPLLCFLRLAVSQKSQTLLPTIQVIVVLALCVAAALALEADEAVTPLNDLAILGEAKGGEDTAATAAAQAEDAANAAKTRSNLPG